MKRKCHWCGKEFKVTKKRKWYCSDKCDAAHVKHREEDLGIFI